MEWTQQSVSSESVGLIELTGVWMELTDGHGQMYRDRKEMDLK